VTEHSRNKCRKVSLLTESGTNPRQKGQFSVTFGRKCDSLSAVCSRLFRHLKINYLKSLSRNVQFHPDMKFFIINSVGNVVLVILENPLTTVMSETDRVW
jgi:hypothetical protein